MTPQPLERDRERILQIVERLLEQTRSERIQWQPSSTSSYIYSTTASSVTVGCVDNDDSFPYDITVFNRSGNAVAHLRFMGNDKLADEVEELYRLAGRSHLQVDETLDSLLGELDDEPPF